MGPSVGTGHDPGTWPSGLDGASAFAETAAVKTVTGEGPGRWRTAGAGSGAAVLCAVKQKMNEMIAFTSTGGWWVLHRPPMQRSVITSNQPKSG